MKTPQKEKVLRKVIQSEMLLLISLTCCAVMIGRLFGVVTRVGTVTTGDGQTG
jgi:hypothetical protein